MRKSILFFSSVLFLTVFICGCSGFCETKESNEFADMFMKNVQKKSDATNLAVAKLNSGMTSEEVIKLLGEPIAKEYKGQSGNTLKTYFYLTDAKLLKSNTCWKMYTPLAFENDKLIGWGWSYFDTLAIKYKFSVDKSSLCSRNLNN